MPYIGRGLEKGNYLKLDDISSQFDGSKTTFNLTVGGSAHVPGSSYSLLVSLSGIIQEGEAAYTLDQNQITFAAAPLAVDDCYIISLGTPIGIGVPGDGTVSGPQFAKPFNYDNFFHLDHTNNRVGIGTSLPTQSLDVYDGNIAIRDPATASQSLGFYHNRNVLKASIDKTGNNLTFENVDAGIIDYKIGGSSRVSIGSTGKIFFGTDDDTYFYRPGADTLGFFTAGTERLRIASDGKVGIGTDTIDGNLHVYNSTAGSVTAAGDANELVLESAANVGMSLLTGATSVARIKFGSPTANNRGVFAYRHDDDAFIFNLAGTEKLRITSDGKVGINSTIPTKKLDIVGFGTDNGIRVGDNHFYAFSDNDVGTKGSPTFRNLNNNANTVLRVIPNGTGKAQFEFFANDFYSNTTSWKNLRILADPSDDYISVNTAAASTVSGSSKHLVFETEYINNGTVRSNPNQLVLNNSGNVGIGTSTLTANKKLSVYGGVMIDGTHATQVTLDVDNKVGMANTAGAEQPILNLRGDIANNGQLVFKNYRLRNGNNWETSAFRIQRRVDVSNMGYIDFGTGAGVAGRDIQFGNGSGTVYMHFDSSQGHVGIGTTAPRQKFEVIGTQASGRPTFQHESGFGGLQIAGPAMGSGAGLHFTRGYAASGTGTTTFSLFMSGGDQSLSFISGDSSEYLTKTRMFIESGGFVGIGTRNPDEELHVYGTSGDPSIFLENGGTGASDDTVIKCAIGDTTANNYIYFGDKDDSNVGQIRYNHNDDFMTFNTSALERVRINDDGRMNIGGTNEVQLTASSQAVLYLHGAIVGADLDNVFALRIIMDDDDTGTTTGDRERGSVYAQFNGNAAGGNTTDETRLWNIWSDVNCNSDYDNVYGLYSDNRTSHSSGTVSNMRGVYSLVQKTSSGTVTEMIGVYGIAQPTSGSSGTVADVIGGRFKANMSAGTSTAVATDLVGVWSHIDNDNNQTQPSGGKCALFFGSYDKTTGLDDPQGIRIDTEVPNYFRGGLYIGNTSNTLPNKAKLHVVSEVGVTTSIVAKFRNPEGASDVEGRIALIAGYSDTANDQEGHVHIGARRSGNGNQAHITFSTYNGSAMAERMRITSAGKVRIGGENNPGDGINSTTTSWLHVQGDDSAGGVPIQTWRSDSDFLQLTGPTAGDFEFKNTGNGTNLAIADGTGGIRMDYYDNGNELGMKENYVYSNRAYADTTTTAGNLHVHTNGRIRRSNSSQRFKNNIREYVGVGVSVIKQIVPKLWEDHADGDTNLGFIAEDIHNLGLTNSVIYGPYMGGSEIGIGVTYGDSYGNGTSPVTKTGEALDDEVEVVDGVNLTAIVAELVVAVKQLTARIETLESGG